MGAPIIYTTSQLTTVLNAGQCCLSKVMFRGVANEFYYKDEECDAFEKGERLYLYLVALSAWVQNADGTVSPGVINPYSQEAFAAMVGFVASHCGCTLGPSEPAHLAWRGILPVCETSSTAYRTQLSSKYCVLDVNGRNNGQSGFSVLEQFNTSTGVVTTVTKPNVPGDPDYTAPTADGVTCPLPSTAWMPTGPYCIQDATSHNSGQQGYTTLSQVIAGTQSLTGITKPNVPGDPNYVAPYANGTACPLPTRVWVGISPFCITDGTGHNTGMRGFQSLQQNFADNNQPTGQTKPNLAADPNYAPAVSDLADCPLTVLGWRGRATSAFCVQDATNHNTGLKGYLVLEQYYTDTNAATGMTKPNVKSDPNYLPPATDVSCPVVGTAYRVQLSSASCLQSAGVNTGQKTYGMLEQYYLDNGVATGVTKANTSTDPDYVAPVTDTTACPVPVTITLVADQGTGNTTVSSGTLNLVSGNTAAGKQTVSQLVQSAAYNLLITNDSKSVISQIVITNTDGVQTIVPTPVYTSQGWSVSAIISGKNTTVEIMQSALQWAVDPSTVSCVQATSGAAGNTGYKAWSGLLQQYATSLQPTGVTKPNAQADPNYITPVQDFATCPPVNQSAVYYGADGVAYTLSNLTMKAYGAVHNPITLAYTSANGQYLWILFPVSYGTLTSVADNYGSQIISAFAAQGTVIIGGITYSSWRMNYPIGTITNYNLTYGFT